MPNHTCPTQSLADQLHLDRAINDLESLYHHYPFRFALACVLIQLVSSWSRFQKWRYGSCPHCGRILFPSPPA